MSDVRIELRGAGGEPVGFARTLLSHGVAELPPNAVEPDGSALETVLPAGGSAWLVRVVAGPPRIRADRAATTPRRRTRWSRRSGGCSAWTTT